MNPINYLDILKLAAPETIVTLTVLVVLGADVTVMCGKSIAARFNVGALLSILGCVSAALAGVSTRERNGCQSRASMNRNAAKRLNQV